MEYASVMVKIERLDPAIVPVYKKLWSARLSNVDAERYARALCSANGGKKLRRVKFANRADGGYAHDDGLMSLPQRPSLGLVIHESAHFVAVRASLKKHKRRVKTWSGTALRTRYTRFRSNKGKHIHHGIAFARTVIELTRQVV